MGERRFEARIFGQKIGEMRKEERRKGEEARQPDTQTKETFLDQITEAIGEKNTQFDERWFIDNRWRIKRAGFDPDSTDEGYIKMVAGELGADKDLMKKWQYRKIKGEISNSIALRERIGKEKEEGKGEFIPKETTDLADRYLMLNFLNKRVKEKDLSFTKEAEERMLDLERRKEELSEKEKEELKNLKEKQELFDAQKVLAEKITGRNLEKEAKEERKEIEENHREKQKIFDQRQNEYKEIKTEYETTNQEYERLGEIMRDLEKKRNLAEKKKNQCMKKYDEANRIYLLARGTPVEELARNNYFSVKTEYENADKEYKDLYQKHIDVWNQKDGIEKELKKIKGEENDKEKAMDSAQKAYRNAKKKSHIKTIGKILEDKVRTIARTPEDAKGGIEAFYKRKRQEVAIEALKAKVMPKSEEEEEEIKKLYDKEGIDIYALCQELLEPKMVKKIQKNPGKGIEKFCKDNNLPFDSKVFEDYSKKISEKGWTPGELVKDEPGIFSLLFGFLYYLLLGKEEREERLEEYFKKTE
jgi:hypothetical protein